MKILIIHTYYNLKGGEDFVFEQETFLLKEVATVDTLVFHNNVGIRGLFQFISSIWNISSSSKLKKKIKEFGPDIIHLHNWHFAAGPLVIRTISRVNIPIVITLHNYRLLCPSAIFLHDGKVFLNSLKRKFPFKAIKNGLYRNSRLLTFWLSFVNWFHNAIMTWDKANRYILLTDFAKNIFISSSLKISDEKYIVKPNFIDILKYKSTNKQRNGFLFIGRLSEEKGIACLLGAFSNFPYDIYIAGEGPLKNYVEECSMRHDNITYLGSLTKDEVFGQMILRKVLIFPSIWYEGMPMTIIEAFSVGMPVIASNLGAMGSMIEDGYNGLLFEAGNSDDLRAKIIKWENYTFEEKTIMSQNAYDTYLKNYTSERNIKLLMRIYEDVINENKNV